MKDRRENLQQPAQLYVDWRMLLTGGLAAFFVVPLTALKD